MNPRSLEPGAIIDYDTVYRDYLRSLIDTLRGFSAGLPGLELWVPHEDERISLRNLLDVAAAAGMPRLVVRFGPVHRTHLDAAGLRAVAAPYGEVQIHEAPDALEITIEGLRLAAVLPEGRVAGTSARVAATTAGGARKRATEADARGRAAAAARTATTVYDKALALAAGHLQHERQVGTQAILQSPLQQHPGATANHSVPVEVSAAHEGARLVLQIDPSDHVIADAVWAYATTTATDTTRALLDRLCDLARGLPILELAQHGIIRLEAALRDPQAPRPVAGIVLPTTAHPMFHLPTTLVRAALADYRTQTGYGETVCRFDARPNPTWLQATQTERLAMIATALAEPLGLLNLSSSDVYPIAVEHDVRVVFALPDDLPSLQRQRLLLDIEAHIQRTVDPRLELHAEERKDRNKLRRLAVLQGSTQGSTKEAS
jgi:hypothetical protein